MKVGRWMKDFYRNNLIIRILVRIIIVILILVLLVVLVLNFWLPLGGKISKNDRKDYEERSINFKDGKFQNIHEFEMIQRNSEENIYLSTKDVIPKEILKAETPTLLDNPKEEDLTFTWFGHSTLLIQMSKMNILVDPIFSDYSSPLQGVGPKRFSELPMEIDELPNIDIVLITHDHYDHLDYNSIRKLKDKVREFVVPLGVEKHLQRWGVDSNKIHNMAWWEEYVINDLTIALTPARHYSSRSINDRYNTLWGSYVLMNENYKIYESGDSGYDDHFKEIYERYGEFDLAFVECGQYNTMWANSHMMPEFSVQAMEELHAKVIMPIHWGTFKLAKHPWDDSVERFVKKAAEDEIEAITPKIGETVNYMGYDSYIGNNWWKDIE